MNDSPGAIEAPAPPLRHWHRLALADIADALTALSPFVSTALEPTPAKIETIALALERAAAHIRGLAWDPIPEPERRLRLQAKELLELADSAIRRPPEAREDALASLESFVRRFRPRSVG